MNILIVDDSSTTRKVIRRSLVAAGICDDQIGEAGDGCNALDQLQAQPAPMLVLCDVNMPRMGGEELLEAASALAVRHTFVMVTSVATARKKLDFIRLGAVKIVPKPFDPNVLADVLGPYLPSHSETPAPAEAALAESTQAPLPDDAALTTLGLGALQSVLEQMAFSEVIPVNGDPPAIVLYGASVRLDAGPKAWIVRLVTDTSGAGELSKRITGQDPLEDQGPRLDAMRELVSMVGGQLATRAAARFQDATPSLAMGSLLPPGAITHAMRGIRLVPGWHHVWLHVEPLP
jgi:two-component system, chemotaxis family, chemotaxis protein CheY